MKRQTPLPAPALRACARHGVVPTRFALHVNIAAQTTALFERAPAAPRQYKWVKTFRCSTSKYGIGEVSGSNMTPRGLHRIAEKIGGGWPIGAAFQSRNITGFTWSGKPLAPITTRIFWLEGLEAGFNRGGNVDSHARYIYVHGTGNELTIGRPDSHGCVHLAADDLIPLYDKLPSGTLVWISER
jgi:L,D-transpeptidase-like protein